MLDSAAFFTALCEALTPSALTLTCIFAIIGYLLVPDAKLRTVSHLPTPKSSLPILFNMLDLMFTYKGRLYDFLLDNSRLNDGKPWRMKVPGRPVTIVICNPEGYEDLLKTKFDDYGKGEMQHRNMEDILGNGIFAVDGMLWMHQRKVGSHLFSLQMIRDTMEQVVHEYVAKVNNHLEQVYKNNEEVNFKRLLDLFTLDVFIKIGFGVDLKGVETNTNGPFMDAFERASMNTLVRSTEALAIWPLKKWLNIGCEKQNKKDMKVINDFVYRIIERSMENTRKKREAAESGAALPTAAPAKDLVSLFLEKEHTEYKNGKTVKTDPKFIRDMTIAFLTAGRDTTSQSMSWFVIYMNRYPHVLEKIRTEIKEKLPNLANGTTPIPSMDDVAQLTYLEAALRENLRLNPVLPLNIRMALRDTTLYDGTVIKEGTRFIFPHYAMGRLERNWGPDAAEFKPERWIDPDTGKLIQVSPFKFTAFLGGPRMCLGMKFAFMELKITMASILSKFEVTTVRDPFSYEYLATATLSIKGPLNVKVKPLDA
uniref:Cytochrome P450 n=2 Tax=Globisporangium ultimum (strain ATCC 200006 / CBS 805.95 / DAOM BR144) TaxID=431595 RepID=K3W7E9_GLOUD